MVFVAPVTHPYGRNGFLTTQEQSFFLVSLLPNCPLHHATEPMQPATQVCSQGHSPETSQRGLVKGHFRGLIGLSPRAKPNLETLGLRYDDEVDVAGRTVQYSMTIASYSTRQKVA